MREAIMPVYAPPQVVFTHGEGARLHADNGDQYLDFVSGIAVNSLGHAHPHLVSALKDQADKLWHLSNMFRITEAERLSERLAQMTFADNMFFCNSGAEANECGLKMMRRYHFDNGHPERYRIIGMHGSFHGRTIATISAAGNADYVKGFIPDDQGYDHVPFGDLAALKSMITEHTAGVILEPVQGEGGICVADKEYLESVRALCDEHGILLMFDEVQCGVARTGALFAYQALGVTPDILSSAKGIGGGFPLGACMATAKASHSMVVGTHGSTFGGNPLATAVGNAVLDVLETEGFMQSVSDNGDYLRSQLRGLATKYPNVFGEVSGLGLMLGISVKPVNTELLIEMRDKHQILIAKAGGNSLRFLPPLIINQADIDQLIDALDQVAAGYA